MEMLLEKRGNLSFGNHHTTLTFILYSLVADEENISNDRNDQTHYY